MFIMVFSLETKHSGLPPFIDAALDRLRVVAGRDFISWKLPSISWPLSAQTAVIKQCFRRSPTAQRLIISVEGALRPENEVKRVRAGRSSLSGESQVLEGFIHSCTSLENPCAFGST